MERHRERFSVCEFTVRVKGGHLRTCSESGVHHSVVLLPSNYSYALTCSGCRRENRRDPRHSERVWGESCDREARRNPGEGENGRSRAVENDRSHAAENVSCGLSPECDCDIGVLSSHPCRPFCPRSPFLALCGRTWDSCHVYPRLCRLVLGTGP